MLALPRPLPASPEEVTPAWLNVALRDAGVLRRGDVSALSWQRVGEGHGLTGTVARLLPRYVDLTDDELPPPSLIAKFASAARGAREVRFYREIAPDSPVPAPRLYAGDADDAGHVVLLLEDLAEARPGDVLRGCTPEEALLVVEAIAPFHARWWARLDSDVLPWLPRWAGDYGARQERFDRRAGPFLERFGAQLPAAIRDLVGRLRGGYADVLAALDRAPTTVVHADLHLDNVLFNPPGTVPSVEVLDWQGVARGAAAIDVAHFVFGSLGVTDRRAVADDLLRRYYALLIEHGVAGYTLERLREDCRLALLWLLAGTVGWLAGVDVDQIAGRERALVEAALGDGRLVAALLDVDAEGRLRDLVERPDRAPDPPVGQVRQVDRR